MAARVAVLVLVVSMCGLVGCATLDGASGSPGVITGTIEYGGPGAASGRPLAIAVYESYPPQGAPLRSVLVEQYEFPYTFVFEGLPAGRYYVGALIDIDRMDTRYSGMLNELRDPFGYADSAAPIDLGVDEGVSGVIVELEDPAP